MAMIGPERRPIKRTLGLPDVYPQDPKQKEDELTGDNLKHGYKYGPNISLHDEYGTARLQNIVPSKISSFFNSVLNRRKDMVSLQDSGRNKKQQFNAKVETFSPVTAKSKQATDAWFKDLSECSKALNLLAKKVPSFHKKEEIFWKLNEFSVPMQRAAWFIKITASVTDTKNKKRTSSDPSTDWTVTLLRVLRDILVRIMDMQGAQSGLSGHGTLSHQNPNQSPAHMMASAPGTPNPGNFGQGGMMQPGQPGSNSMPGGLPRPQSPTIDVESLAKQWKYSCQLLGYLYQAGMLDRQECLFWILELFERAKGWDDALLDFALPLALHFIHEITLSEVCSRRMATMCGQLLTEMLRDNEVLPAQSVLEAAGVDPKPVEGHYAMMLAPQKKPNYEPPPAASIHILAATLSELASCPYHRRTFFSFSTILQVIALECTSACVWMSAPALKPPVSSSGSPLDLLPLPPSMLPVPYKQNVDVVRRELLIAEEEIRKRSFSSECRWTNYFTTRDRTGTELRRFLRTIDALDRYAYDVMSNSNCIDTLYEAIYTDETKEGLKYPELFEALSEHGVDDGSTWDECVIMALCQWAVTSRRYGEHRALVVSKLLEKRQAEVLGLMAAAAAELQATMRPSKDGSADKSGQSNVPVFQEYLFRFLDTKAPVLENNASWTNKIEFSNLVHLYYELIRNDVFSHDLYMCTLISRGDLPVTNKVESSSTDKFSANAMDTTQATDSKQRFDGGMDLGLGLNLGIGLNANGLTTGDVKPDLNDPMGLGTGKSGPNALGSAEKLPSTSFFDDGHRGGVGLAMEFDEPGHDIDRLIERIDMDNSDSPTKDDNTLKSSLLSMPNRLLPEQDSPTKNARPGDPEAEPSSTTSPRHVLFATHFPIPLEDVGGPPGAHEGNQRNILLFGVGRSRDCARHQVKKVTRDVTKLFTKKFSIDDSKGGRIRNSWNEVYNWESVANRFSALPYYDQHQVIIAACAGMMELLCSYSMGSGSYLPVIDNFVLLTHLMEMANYITGMLDFCAQVLKELPSVDDKIMKRSAHNSGIALQPYYVSPLTLHIVAVYRRFYNFLVLLPEIATSAFEGMVRLVQRVSDPTACRASERLMYSLIWDLYVLGHAMKWNLRVPEGLRVLEDAKSMLIGVSAPSTFNHKWDTTYMQECLDNPKRIPDLHSVSAMRSREKADLRYSFVCNALQRVVKAADNETVNDVALLCTEVVSMCNLLSGDILGLLSCLLRAAPPYSDLRGPLNLSDPTAQLSIAVFVAILVARQAILLEDFIKVAAVPCLMKAWSSNDGLPAGSSTELLARLTCGILYRLYKVTDSPLQFQYPPPLLPSKDARDRYLMHPCDKMLLWGANRGAGIGSILAVLKALLAVVDTAKPDEKKSRDHGKGSSYLHEPTISDIIGTSDGDFDSQGRPQGFVPGRIETAPIHIYAQHVLSELCSQVWVRDRVLVADLCTTDFLMDSALTLPQMLKVLHSFCYPEVKTPIAATPEPKSATTRIVYNLDVWNLKCAVVEIKLLSKHVSSNPAETRRWCDHVAGALLDPFYHHQLPMRDTPSSSPSVEKKRSNRSSTKDHKNEDRDLRPVTPPADGSQHSKRKKERPKLDGEAVWLIPCLIERVVPILHGPILRQCTNVLDNSEWWLRNREKEKEKELRAQTGDRDRERDRERERDRDRDRDGDRTRDRPGKINHHGSEKSSSSMVGSSSSPPSASIASAGAPSYLKYPEQLALLVRTCLRTVDEAIADHFVGGLLGQFQQFLTFHSDKDRKKLFMVDQRVRQQVSDALLLRLHLLGWMYPYLALDGTKLHDLILNMVQFIIHGLVDFDTHNEVFYTIIDMLAGMVHMAIAPDKDADYSGRLDEMRKLFSSLGKRVRKELLDKDSVALDFVRQLLPLPKRMVEIVAVEPMGTVADTKGNRVQGYDTDKKYGLQVADKQRISPWEVVEGGRTPNVLQWAWYRGSKMERKLPRYQMAHRLLLYHTHNLAKDFAFYVEPPPLPEDDTLEPPPEKMIKLEVKEEPQSVDIKFGDRSMTGTVMGGLQNPNMAPNVAIKLPGPSPGGSMSNSVGMNGPSSAGSASGGMQGGPASQTQARKPQKRKRQARAAVNGAQAAVPAPVQPPQPPPQQQQPMMTQPVQPQVGFNQMYTAAGNGPQQNWQGFNQQQTPPYYNQINPGGPRFERPMSQSKQAISNMLRQRHPNAQQFLQGVPNQPGGMVPGQPGMGVGVGVGQQGMVPAQQAGMVQQQPMVAQQTNMANMQQMRPTTPMGPSSGPSANQVPQAGVMQQQNQPQQNPGGQMLRPPMANQRPGMFANQMGNQQGIGQTNYMGGYNNQQGTQQGMMDVNNTGGGQMMANNAGPGNPGGTAGGGMPGGQFNVPMQQYQSTGAAMIRNQQPGGFVGQGTMNQAGMQPRVPMNQMQSRPYGIPNNTNMQGGQGMAAGGANGAAMYGPRAGNMQNPQNMQFQQNPSMMNMRQMTTNQMQPQHQTSMYNQQY